MQDPHRRGLPEADKALIIRLYVDEARPWTEVRDMTGWSKTTIFNVLGERQKHYPNRGPRRTPRPRSRAKRRPLVRTGSWSLEEDCRLLRLWGWQRTHRSMSKRLRRTLKDIRERLGYLRETYGLTRSDAKFIEEGKLEPKKVNVVRPCLACRAPFPSEGAHHRICDQCKGSKAWREGDEDSFAVAPHGLTGAR